MEKPSITWQLKDEGSKRNQGVVESIRDRVKLHITLALACIGDLDCAYAISRLSR